MIGVSDDPPPVKKKRTTSEAIERLTQIRALLTPAEAEAGNRLVVSMSASERDQWMEVLCSRSVEEGALLVRRVLQKQQGVAA
jgi:hypothetical protein